MKMIGPYTKEVIKHFKHPKNYGKMKAPDGIGRAGNILCGDIMHLYIKVKNDKIADIKFETFGCVAAISTSSVVTQLAKGKTLEKALDISQNQIIKTLGGLPPVKYHCSLLGIDALSEAIYDYLSKKKRPIPKKLKLTHQRIEKEKREIQKMYKSWQKKIK